MYNAILYGNNRKGKTMYLLNVQKYLMEKGLESLQKEFDIVVTDYPDFVVLNYNQISSPRFHPIVDECRALILRKSDWKVMCRSFDRFYNWGESIQQLDTTTPATQRITSFDTYLTKDFELTNAIIEEKLDGSIISVWFDGKQWQTSTRKMAYGEGQTAMGRTFHEIFMDAVKDTNLFTVLNAGKEDATISNTTYVFELTGPENRVVTPYAENKAFLIGVRNNLYGNEYYTENLDGLAKIFGVGRPNYYKVSSYEELLKLVQAFPAMNEGVVLKSENSGESHWRIKLKNPAYLAIAHLRSNGTISPKRILTLILENDHIEYLGYFECDKPYFSFAEEFYNDTKNRIKAIFEEHKGIADQKEFALAIMPKTVYGFENGIIFNLRKKGGTVEEKLKEVGGDKISKAMNLKQKFIDKFHVVVEEEEV